MDPVQPVAVAGVAPVHPGMAVLPAAMTAVLVVLAHTLSGQALIRQDVAPLALTYVGFLLMLAFRVRRGRRPALPEGGAALEGTEGLAPLARFVLVTATAGYAVF